MIEAAAYTGEAHRDWGWHTGRVAELAAGRVCVELGYRFGDGSQLLLDAGAVAVYAIDTLDVPPIPDPRLRFILGLIEESRSLVPDAYGLLVVDADHAAGSVALYLEMYGCEAEHIALHDMEQDATMDGGRADAMLAAAAWAERHRRPFDYRPGDHGFVFIGPRPGELKPRS